jgi:16S rRNA (cytidine1402-2'-O)-methyltransferase
LRVTSRGLGDVYKRQEETRTGPVAEILSHFSAHPPKGEIVMIIHGKK